MRPSRKPLLLLSFVGIVVATASARAQAPSEYPAACDAAKISRAESDRAHTVFLSGKGFLDESNYDKAISYFKDAYTIDCSVHGILPIIATAYERKGDKAEAVNALEEYLRRQPSAPDRDVVEHRIKNLKEQLQAAAPSATTPASATATTSAAPGSAPPTGPSTEPTTTAGTPESPPTSSGHTPTPWIVTGAGGAVLVAGVIIFIVGANGDVSNTPRRRALSQRTARARRPSARVTTAARSKAWAKASASLGLRPSPGDWFGTSSRSPRPRSPPRPRPPRLRGRPFAWHRSSCRRTQASASAAPSDRAAHRPWWSWARIARRIWSRVPPRAEG